MLWTANEGSELNATPWILSLVWILQWNGRSAHIITLYDVLKMSSLQWGHRYMYRDIDNMDTANCWIYVNTRNRTTTNEKCNTHSFEKFVKMLPIICDICLYEFREVFIARLHMATPDLVPCPYQRFGIKARVHRGIQIAWCLGNYD